MCRCDNAHAQQQLQQHFEAQFLHKPWDLKAKLRSQMRQQQQHQGQAGSSNAQLRWTSCMPGARLQQGAASGHAGVSPVPAAVVYVQGLRRFGNADSPAGQQTGNECTKAFWPLLHKCVANHHVHKCMA